MVDAAGLAGLIVFYVVVLVIGLWAAYYKTRKVGQGKSQTENIIVAGRDIGVFVGVFTLTATWVGGGYINGTAEIVYNQGLIWAQAPIGYTLSLVVGGMFFAKQMREKNYVTMLDPFQEKYGRFIGGLLYVPAFLGEVFWSGAVLSALGATISVILEFDIKWSIIISACFAVGYTFFGGLYSVAYTDVVQLFCITFGLILCVPFAWHNSHVIFVSNETTGEYWYNNWLGQPLLPYEYGYYIDGFLLLIFGGLPWQDYFQRVLAAKNPRKAQMLSYLGALGCFLMAIPPILVGIIAKNADFGNASHGEYSNAFIANHTAIVLPAVIGILTPTAVKFFGLGAVSAAVMSSADSAILSASSMFAYNIYKMMFRRNSTDREITWVIRISVVATGVVACFLGITVESVYALWYLSSDFVYVLLFPQLVCVIYRIPLNS